MHSGSAGAGAAWELPGYDVQELVGFGATGEVWRAVDAAGAVIALKRLRTADPSARDRLRREAALVSAASGPHIVRVRDVVATPDEAVLVMDYAAGGSLAGILAVRGRLAAPEVVTLVGPLAGALADVHERGIVHGDVTPANVLFTGDGRPLLADFGVARLAGAPGAVEATHAYAAPEVLAGRPPSPASDVWSLCRVALEALDASTAPARLVEALRAGVVDDPHDRPDARDLALDVLSSCAAAPVGLVRTAGATPPVLTTPVRAPLPPAARRDGAPPPRRHRMPRRLRLPRIPARVVAGAAAVVAVAAAVAGGVTWGSRSESSAATLPRVTPPRVPAPRVPAPDWRGIVQRLDQVRARAVATGDPQLLATVYAPGCTALPRDRAMLLDLVRHGWRPVGLRVSTSAVAVVEQDATTATLRVTHALSAYTVVDSAGSVRRRVPATPQRTFTMRLVKVAGEWRVAAVGRNEPPG